VELAGQHFEAVQVAALRVGQASHSAPSVSNFRIGWRASFQSSISHMVCRLTNDLRRARPSLAVKVRQRRGARRLLDGVIELQDGRAAGGQLVVEGDFVAMPMDSTRLELKEDEGIT